MIRVYLKYKLWALKQWFGSFGKLSGLSDILFGMFVLFAGMDIIWPEGRYIVLAAVAAIFWLVLSVYRDYNAGRHMSWFREQYKKKFSEVVKDGEKRNE
jgi:hypothetical protein